MEGFLKIYRNFFVDELWCEKRVFSRAEAWIDLLRMARYCEEGESTLIGNTRVVIARGQLPISLRYLAERWDWSKHKVDDFIKYLVLTSMLKTGTAEGTRQTVATVCNYDIYNSVIDDMGTVIGTSKGHQRDIKGTNKKKDKKDKKIICESKDDNYSGKNKNAREEKIEDKTAPTWRTSFEIYKADLRKAFIELINDQAFLATQQKFQPKVDIRLTLEKACINFWATEAGWANKKQKHAQTINWRSTLTNALSQSQNKVYHESGANSNSQKPSKRDEREGMVAAIFGRNGIAPSADDGRYCGFDDAEEV